MSAVNTVTVGRVESTLNKGTRAGNEGGERVGYTVTIPESSIDGLTPTVVKNLVLEAIEGRLVKRFANLNKKGQSGSADLWVGSPQSWLETMVGKLSDSWAKFDAEFQTVAGAGRKAVLVSKEDFAAIGAALFDDSKFWVSVGTVQEWERKGFEATPARKKDMLAILGSLVCSSTANVIKRAGGEMGFDRLVFAGKLVEILVDAALVDTYPQLLVALEATLNKPEIAAVDADGLV